MMFRGRKSSGDTRVMQEIRHMSGNKTRASVMRKFTGLIPPGSEEKLAADVGRIKHILQGGTFACSFPVTLTRVHLAVVA